MATNLQEIVSSGTPVAALLGDNAAKVARAKIPEPTINIPGGPSPLEIPKLGGEPSSDSSSTGITSPAIVPSDFFADLLENASSNNFDSDSLFSFREGVIQRIVEADPATLSSLVESSQATALPTTRKPSTSGFDDLFGGSDSGEGDSYGSLDSYSSGSFSESSGSFSEAEAASSAFSDAERSAMAGIVGKGLNTAQGLAAGRDFSAVDFATSAISANTGAIGATYGAYNSFSGLSNIGDINSISGALGAINAAVGAASAAQSVAGALTSGKSISDLVGAAFDNVQSAAEAAWSAIQDPAAALDAFGEVAQYGSLNATNLSFDLPSGRASYSLDGKTGKLNTPAFLSIMMGMVPFVGTVSSLAQRGMKEFGYIDSMSDRAVGFATAFGSTPGFSLGDEAATEATGVGVTGYGNLGTVADFSFSVPGMPDFSLQADFSAMNTSWANLSVQDINQASVAQHNLDWDEEEAANQAASTMGRAIAADLGLDPNSDINSPESMAALGGIASVASEAFTGAMDAMGYSFSDLSLDEAFSTSDRDVSRAEEAYAAQNYQDAIDHAKGSHTQSNTMSDHAMAAAWGHQAARDTVSTMASNAMGIDVVSVNFADLTEAEKSALSAAYGTSSTSSTSGYGISYGAFEGGSVDQEGNFSYNTFSDMVQGIQNSFRTGWYGYPGDPNAPGFNAPGRGYDQDYEETAPDPVGYSWTDADLGGTGAPDAAAGPGAESMSGISDSFGADDHSSGPEGEGGGGGDSGGGGGAGTYICTAAYANGVTDYSTFSANRKYGIQLRRNDPYLMKGYDLVGPTYAKWFGNNGVGKILTNYYKKSVMGEQLSWKYKLLEKFLLYINRPALRTLGYLHERISSKG